MHPNLANAALFRGADPRDVAELCDSLVSQRFDSGEVIFEQGEHGEFLYIIVNGKVKIGSSADDGRENLFHILGPSDMFGELAILDSGPRISSARALTDVEAVAMDREVLRAWMAPRPEVAEQLMRVLARQLRRMTSSRTDLVFNDAPGRVAKLLLRLAQRFGVQRDGSVLVDHDLTQDEIAQLVGSSRETVNKVLNDFTHRGWIELRSKGLLISDTERLARRAQV
ncbi:Crp/Fnr family transcriptional regulator [Mycolicibacterium rhodesiae]|uniref:CRP-like cAMP-activated global transcriptional regulator n=1 Tax=Mycolicibacterium rhodesiae TaxID=36814 RepID=A0A1X0J3V7_MYCRH|nr:Crp/Fnr family transcriptional regulator [Mycolicibacterium rhodesiae]MCV7344587.1 Crp/Fnr family transcriptional regulator [Mycolicibacterium rhodesiae]ORB55925.1 Crp/Fnr family transcriptional regulator [Mycolicibacterium rhodesiae]